MYKYRSLLACFWFCTRYLAGQNDLSAFTGIYSDGISDGFQTTRLELKADQTFRLLTQDPVFTYTFKTYENTGTWAGNGKEIILNPDKLPRKTCIELHEEANAPQDSIIIQIHYELEEYEKEQLKGRAPFEFQMLTIFINGKKTFFNLVRAPQRRICSFSHKVKNQVIVDSLNQFKIARQDIHRLGVYTYGFDDVRWFGVQNPDTNRFEFTIIQPVDVERTPRSKKVVFKKGKAYFYERSGKVNTSWMANGLTKK